MNWETTSAVSSGEHGKMKAPMVCGPPNAPSCFWRCASLGRVHLISLIFPCTCGLSSSKMNKQSVVRHPLLFPRNLPSFSRSLLQSSQIASIPQRKCMFLQWDFLQLLTLLLKLPLALAFKIFSTLILIVSLCIHTTQEVLLVKVTSLVVERQIVLDFLFINITGPVET